VTCTNLQPRPPPLQCYKCNNLLFGLACTSRPFSSPPPLSPCLSLSLSFSLSQRYMISGPLITLIFGSSFGMNKATFQVLKSLITKRGLSSKYTTGKSFNAPLPHIGASSGTICLQIVPVLVLSSYNTNLCTVFRPKRICKNKRDRCIVLLAHWQLYQ
jgi:hypothetical protein